MLSTTPILTINDLLAYIIQCGFDGVVQIQDKEEVYNVSEVKLQKGIIDGQETVVLVIS